MANHPLQLQRGADRRGCRRVTGVGVLFSTLLSRLLTLLGSSPPVTVVTPTFEKIRNQSRRRPLHNPLRQRLRLLQRAAAATGNRPLLPTQALVTATQNHSGLRLGLSVLTTQEHLGRQNHRSRRRGPWLRDWLRQCYMPPRMAEQHRLRSSCTPGLRYWFRADELALLEPWQKPAHQAGWWQQEASGYKESRYPRNSEMSLWVQLMANYYERFS